MTIFGILFVFVCGIVSGWFAAESGMTIGRTKYGRDGS